MTRADAIVVGAGLYGCWIALFLRRMGLQRVVLLEREDTICARASFWNQARLHNGYHYPRAFTTAFRSRVNLPRFEAEFGDSVVRDSTSLYAIARSGSKVTPQGFRRFCAEIGARLEPAPESLAGLFSPRLIAGVWVVDEPIFDAHLLADQLRRQLDEASVELRLSTEVTELRAGPSVVIDDEVLTAGLVFNCTYAGLDRLRDRSALKFEAAELALIEPPPALASLGVTVMDGPFFSTLPFPPRGVHSLSHVRYTPHIAWTSEDTDRSPYEVLADLPKESRAPAMLRDAARYLPALAQSRIVGSFFEVKAIRRANEMDDGRPILLEEHGAIPGAWSVLGGKLDNIYDVGEALGPIVAAGVP